MIVVKLMGGMGNQMFQYAAAYNLGAILKQEVIVDTEEYKNNNYRRFMLRALKPHILKKDTLSFFMCIKYFYKKKIICFYERKIVGTKLESSNLITKLLGQLGIIAVYNYYNSKILEELIKQKYFRNKKLIYLSGYFQCKQCFEQNYNVILTQYSNDLLKYKVKYGENAICIHIRCGDYVGNKYFGICTKNYYTKSLKLMKAIKPNATVYVFSDDIGYVKKNIIKEDSFIYFTSNSEKEALCAMKSCKYFILSNSTFGWWAQELCEYDDKIVIAPSRWYGNGGKSLLYESNWILLNPDP